MVDRYLDAMRSPLGSVAKRLGVPAPPVLRRYDPAVPLVPGPVLVIGLGAAAGGTATSDAPDADRLAATLSSWGLRSERGDEIPWGAIVVVLSEAARPEDVAAPVMELSAALRHLAPNGRVLTISRPATEVRDPATAATREGVEGLLRSVAKELRYGATGNGVVLTESADVCSASALAAIRFFLSDRSAFVDGQLLRVGPAAATFEATDRPLAGRLAVVTGAARGIGAQVARTLARDGAQLVVVDVPASGEALAAVANEVRGTALQLDITSPDAGARIARAAARHGGIDILVNNAGVLRDKLLANMKPEQWDSVVAVNLSAQLRIVHHLLDAGGFGAAPRVVSLASTSGIAGNRGQSNYAFSKAGVIGHTRAFAPLLAAVGGTANAVAPGFIETTMTATIPFAARQLARRASSLGQGGLPIDVAEAIAFLASPDAGGVNGQVLRVCGQSLVGR